MVHCLSDTRSQLIRHRERDLYGLTDAHLRDRLALAEAFREVVLAQGYVAESASSQRLAVRRDQVEVELERRRG
jgi:hypothetical protein